MSDTANKTEENNSVPGYTSTKVGDHTVITPKDKKASVYQKVTPREQYAVARDVANRAINEINAIRSRRPSSFTGGINDANIAARMQAAETYGDTLPGGRGYSRSRRAAYDIADSYRNVLATAPKPPSRPTPTIPTPTPRPSDPTVRGTPKPKPTPVGEPKGIPIPFETTWKPTDNYDGGGYKPGQFGRGPKYAEYEDLFRNSINEGFTLEEAMKLSRTATPYDWEQAFGTADQWRKIGGGSKGGGVGGKGGFTSKAGKSGFSKGHSVSATGPCDIRLKTDIAPLMSTEIKDDLAELAFFVKKIRVK